MSGSHTLPPTGRVDVAIVGAGAAGAAAAIALRQAGVDRVVLIDSGEVPSFRIGESVPPDMRPLLASLGLLDRFLADEHAPCLGSASCWGSDRMGHNDFIFNIHGHGWHLDRPRFDRMLCDAARQAGAVVLVGRRAVRAADRPGGGVDIELAGGDLILAHRVIDATGHPARIARQLGGVRIEDDRLICVSRFLRIPADRHLDRLSHLEAVADGWWYAADIGHGRAVTMIATDSATLRRKSLTQVDGWLAGLARTTHIAPLLAGSRAIAGSPDLHVRIAPSARLASAAGRHWLAAGDAAAVFDPISAQGIIHALATGRAAGHAAASALSGDHGAAERFARAVQDGHAGYLANRAHFYGVEDRWPTSPFWAARRAAVAPDAENERRAG